MGVKSCHRNTCKNIMADTYVSSVGYVCDECQEEFKEYLKQNNRDPKTDVEIEIQLKAFMETVKGCYAIKKGKPISVSDFFRQHTQ